MDLRRVGLALESYPCLLHGVLRLAERPEDRVGDPLEKWSVALELGREPVAVVPVPASE